MKWFGYLVFALLIATAWSCKDEPNNKDNRLNEYQVGTLTKGNPDNTYLDSCDIYCCGD